MNKIKRLLIKFVFIFILILWESSIAFSATQKLEIIDNKTYRKIVDDLNLSSRDIKLYKEIFDAVDECRWDKEEKRKVKLANDVLLGHTLAIKYLSSCYTSSYEELLEWLEKYNDYPEYDRIYKLASQKGNAEDLSDSLEYSQAIPESGVYGYNWSFEDFPNLSKENRKYVLDRVKRFRKYINSGKSKAAKNILEDPKFRKLVPNRTWDSMSGTLTTLYFTDNYDKLAYEWSTRPRRRSEDVIAMWFGGLAAWRLGNYTKAAELFDKLARLNIKDEWMMSSGGYWAYRAHMKLNNPEQAKEALFEAAKYKRTFYGILASHQLGEEYNYNWTFYSFSTNFSNNDYINLILSSPALKRAVVLASIGQIKLAGDEIVKAYKSLDDNQKEIAMFIAEQYGMHNLAIRISNNLKDFDNDVYYDYISYPLPDWSNNSWDIDQALVLAFIRRESMFYTEAQSPKGARGLMQIMPNTAIYVSNDDNIKKDAASLFKPEYNIEIGQKYIKYLMEKPYIENNLFFLLTAYNAGPGNLLKWKKHTRYKDDPLMYMEAIPSRETRIYIKRVMTNYWIYNFRLQKQSSSLEELANDEWPTL